MARYLYLLENRAKFKKVTRHNSSLGTNVDALLIERFRTCLRAAFQLFHGLHSIGERTIMVSGVVAAASPSHPRPLVVHRNKKSTILTVATCIERNMRAAVDDLSKVPSTNQILQIPCRKVINVVSRTRLLRHRYCQKKSNLLDATVRAFTDVLFTKGRLVHHFDKPDPNRVSCHLIKEVVCRTLLNSPTIGNV